MMSEKAFYAIECQFFILLKHRNVPYQRCRDHLHDVLTEEFGVRVSFRVKHGRQWLGLQECQQPLNSEE